MMSVANVDSDFLNSTLATVTEISHAVNQTGNDTLAGKTMLDEEWLENAENLTSSFNSTGNETVDGRSIFFYPNIPTIKEEHATSFLIILLMIVMMVICTAVYKCYVLPKRRTRGTDTDTESKFRLMENELEHQHEDRF
ncbi:unnamed protein product [Oikopleura dioica]|uniref:Uncharacterized protein n=1 Tax=Oikopleura dioica TaxID=34765 RepID=E4XMU6_OIKDI|nr:unnamed protein product [Oikopleura dioica]